MRSQSVPITIPKMLTKGEELVVVPRKEYEGLLRFYNVQHIASKKVHRKKETHASGKLTKGLREALADVASGRISKAYDDVDEMMKDMLS